MLNPNHNLCSFRPQRKLRSLYIKARSGQIRLAPHLMKKITCSCDASINLNDLHKSNVHEYQLDDRICQLGTYFITPACISRYIRSIYSCVCTYMYVYTSLCANFYKFLYNSYEVVGKLNFKTTRRGCRRVRVCTKDSRETSHEGIRVS